MKNLEQNSACFSGLSLQRDSWKWKLLAEEYEYFYYFFCMLSSCYLGSLKQFLGLPVLQNDSLQIVTRIYFNLLKIFANV